MIQTAFEANPISFKQTLLSDGRFGCDSCKNAQRLGFL